MFILEPVSLFSVIHLSVKHTLNWKLLSESHGQRERLCFRVLPSSRARVKSSWLLACIILQSLRASCCCELLLVATSSDHEQEEKASKLSSHSAHGRGSSGKKRARRSRSIIHEPNKASSSSRSYYLLGYDVTSEARKVHSNSSVGSTGK